MQSCILNEHSDQDEPGKITGYRRGSAWCPTRKLQFGVILKDKGKEEKQCLLSVSSPMG